MNRQRIRIVATQGPIALIAADWYEPRTREMDGVKSQIKRILIIDGGTVQRRICKGLLSLFMFTACFQFNQVVFVKQQRNLVGFVSRKKKDIGAPEDGFGLCAMRWNCLGAFALFSSI